MDKLEIINIQKNLKHLALGQRAALNQLMKDKQVQELDLKSGLEELRELGLKIEILKEASTEARSSSRDALQDMATRALQSIIGENVSLKIVLDEKGSSPVADFLVMSEYEGYLVDADPAEEEGGGIADIVSFSNQIAMLQLTGHRNSAPIFLDEPSKYVSAGFSDNFANYLYEYSSYAERQSIMVTHDSHLTRMGDKSFLFKKDSGKTVVSPIITGA